MNLLDIQELLKKKAGKTGFFILALFTVVVASCENDIEKVNLITEKMHYRLNRQPVLKYYTAIQGG